MLALNQRAPSGRGEVLEENVAPSSSFDFGGICGYIRPFGKLLVLSHWHAIPYLPAQWQQCIYRVTSDSVLPRVGEIRDRPMLRRFDIDDTKKVNSAFLLGTRDEKPH